MARKRKTPDASPENGYQPARYDDFLYSDIQDTHNRSRSFAFTEADRPQPGTKPETDPASDDVPVYSDDQPDQPLPDGARQVGDADGFAAGDMPDNVSSDAPQTMEDLQRQMDDSARERERRDGNDLIADMRLRLGVNDRPNKPVKENKHRIRKLVSILITVILVGMVGVTALSTMVDLAIMKMPGTAVARILSPVQGFFSSMTGGLADYFVTLKRRSGLESAYNDLLAENETLAYRAMLADELSIQLSQYEDMYDEVNANSRMNPIVCQVIGKSDSNYFTTFTINKGSRDGIENYMAVTLNGALVGYTENVQPSSCTVRAIIDGEASIAGLIQSSRDQGTVKGALSTDGTPSCRMYYLSDDNLPRPGDSVVTSGVGLSFPKGIPIGTVRESTRGMDANKAYIVVDPLVDFKHVEYVIVLRYKPAAQAVTGRENAAIEFVPLVAKRTAPPLRIGGTSWGSPTPVPEDYASPTPVVTPTPSPTPTPRPTPRPTPVNNVPVYEYQVVSHDPTPIPTDTPEPTPTPYVTLDPAGMTYEEDD